MKKIFSSLLISLCFCLTIMGVGCSSCSPNRNEDGGQSQVETITTLEGVWESEKGRSGEHERVVVEENSIRCYIHEGVGHDYKLRWAGIYVPFIEPISEGSWIFENDDSIIEERPDISAKTFNYSNKKLSCNMADAFGSFRDIYFTKVSD